MLEPPTATTFVGRHRELETLNRKLDLAFAGHGSLAMLVGDDATAYAYTHGLVEEPT